MVFGFGKKKAKKSKDEIDVNSEVTKGNKKEEIDVREKLDNGYIQARVILEILGAPQEHIEQTLHEYVEKLKREKDIHVIKEDFSETEEQGEFFSRFVEVEALFKDTKVLIGFCFDFMPSSVEILEPERTEVFSSDLSALFNDLQARLHQTDMIVKQMKTENTNLRKNATGLLRNLAISILKNKPLDLKELSKKMGIPEDQLKPFMENIEKEDFVKLTNGKYHVGDYLEKEKSSDKKKPKKSSTKKSKKK